MSTLLFTHSNMENVDISYSKKNIPIPSKYEYKVQLVSKVESVIKRMRWKALEFLGQLKGDGKKTFGFASRKIPSPVNELSEFENDLWNMVSNIEFKHVNNNFQSQLKHDIKEIKTSNKIFISADKSRNSYSVEKDEYNKYLKENITKSYRKSTESKLETINLNAQKIAKRLEIDDRMEKMYENECYITVKDHKENFPEKPTFRLINPAKSDIAKISKQYLDQINNELRTRFGLNQWRNSASVIDWFTKIENKDTCSFFTFDIESFYPSISSKLFDRCINFAKEIINIPDEELEIIMHARKTLLIKEKEPWVKKSVDCDFDVPMGSFDGAEVCELTGIFLLNQLSSVVDIKDIGLYRDDGLGVLRGHSGPQTERIRKKIYSVFKDNGLSITLKAGLKRVIFLDITLDLNSGLYMPYRKPNDKPVYIDMKSNHPPAVKKEIVKSVSKRLSSLSSNENVFNKCAPLYETALQESGYTEKLQFYQEIPNENIGERKQRKRKIIWFNPPFSLSVKSNVGRIFLKLISRHFPKENGMSKIFNRNTLKISYSCTKNISSIISSHNRHILNPEPETYNCNCRNPDECPVEGACLIPNVVYQAEITNDIDNEKKFYIGISEPVFKVRYRNHKRDVKNVKYRNFTKLASYVWNLKENGKTPKIMYKIVRKVFGKPKLNFCRLCLAEKLCILEFPEQEMLLNKRSELTNKCMHQNKYLLLNMKNMINDIT